MGRPNNCTPTILVAVKTWLHIANINANETHATDGLEPINFGASEEEVTYISEELKGDERLEMVALLKRNKKKFTWSLDQMPRIYLNMACHKLNIHPQAKLVC